MAIEMRDFKIQSGQMAAFIEAWRAGVVPLRQSQGFRVASCSSTITMRVISMLRNPFALSTAAPICGD